MRIDRCIILDPALESVRAGLRISDVTTGLANGTEVSITDSTTPAKSLTFGAGRTNLETSADAFFQANGGLLTEFVDHVIAAVTPKTGAQIWDLYAGIGLFSIPLANSGANVLLVESSAAADSAIMRI